MAEDMGIGVARILPGVHFFKKKVSLWVHLVYWGCTYKFSL